MIASLFISIASMAATLFVEPPTPSAGSSSSTPNALKGPTVNRPRVSLIERDLHGFLKRLDMPPAEAALALLNLDASSRAKAEAIITARARELDAIVSRHYNLLIDLFSAGQAGDTADSIRLVVVLASKLAPLRDRGPLEAELAAALPDGPAARLIALVKEYRDAVAAEGAIDNGVVRASASRWEALSSESLRLWGEQIRRSFERQSADGAIFFDAILRAMKLRPDQEARARERLARFAEETKLAPTPEQERALVIDLAAWLDKSQLLRLTKLVKGGPDALLKEDKDSKAPAPQ